MSMGFYRLKREDVAGCDHPLTMQFNDKAEAWILGATQDFLSGLAKLQRAEAVNPGVTHASLLIGRQMLDELERAGAGFAMRTEG